MLNASILDIIAGHAVDMLSTSVLDVMLVLILMNGADWAQTNDSTGPNVSPVSSLLTDHFLLALRGLHITILILYWMVARYLEYSDLNRRGSTFAHRILIMRGQCEYQNIFIATQNFKLKIIFGVHFYKLSASINLKYKVPGSGHTTSTRNEEGTKVLTMSTGNEKQKYH